MTSLPSPRKVVPYTVAEDQNGGALFIYGKPDSSNIAIFCAGYANDHKIGQEFCSKLAERSKTLVGLMCPPGYDDRLNKPWYTNKKEGYTFDETADAIRDAVRALCRESTAVKKAKLTGIFHDWGVISGLLWANRSVEDESADSPDELVLFDVLLPLHKDHMIDVPAYKNQSLLERFINITYQFVLAVSFALQLYVSKYAASLCRAVGFGTLNVFGLHPLFQVDDEVIKTYHESIDMHRQIYMGYPYFRAFQTMLLSIMGANGGEFLSQPTLTKDLKKTPILYLYGTEKRIMFHDNGALKYLEREGKECRSKSDAIAVENAGHWLYIQQPEKCLDKVIQFMAKQK